MVFSTPIFIFGFFPVVLFFYFIVFKKSRCAQNFFLTVASLFFYAWGEPYFILLMLGSILLNWLFAILIDRVRENPNKMRVLLVLVVTSNVGLLFVFKYLMFTLNNVNSLFNLDFTIPNIVLPIGISFFTFHSISYVMDIYRQKAPVQKNLLNVALYISFFPQLVAGPIVRYETIANQIYSRKETFEDFSYGICRFIIGLSKKVIIANNLGIVADKIFDGTSHSVLTAWIGAIAYTFQIYYDFSGYSDMAIGLGRIFGFHFLENFNYPYISKSITEFWRRWHISLGTFFRDYVYITLGGSRVNSNYRLVFNLLVVWFLTGVWHGANWTFFIWGIMYFILITFEKLTGFLKRIGVFGHIYSMLFIIIGWVIFKSNNIGDAIFFLKNMFGLGSFKLTDSESVFYLNENFFFLMFGVLCSMPLSHWFSNKSKGYKVYNIFYPIVMTFLFLTSISFIVKSSYNPFIYFNF